MGKCTSHRSKTISAHQVLKMTASRVVECKIKIH